MIRIMIDSNVLADLPAGLAPLLATYSDLIPTLAALKALQDKHPDSEIILIDRGLGDPTGLASIADVETGALKPASLPDWFRRKAAAKIDFLTVYCNRSTLAAVAAALKGTGHENHWRWIATLDGMLAIDGFVPLRRPAVVQALGESSLGIHGDMSLALEDRWHPAVAS